ncbi:MAG: hypothetical protein HY606_09550 [Planctomycetes bacterium]|nr:hypothetical protein [Planctomycetota bacterium]
MKIKVMLVVVFFEIAGAINLYAGNEGYFTGYSHRIEKDEIEVMLMTDFTLPSKFKRDEDIGSFVSQMLEIEYGLTKQTALELMPEWWYEPSTGNSEFTGLRLEWRYRVFEEEKFVNLVLYSEFEYLKKTTRFKMETSGWIDPPYLEAAETEPDFEKILETRIILSKDIGSTNFTFNWINETDVHAGGTAYGYSLGMMYHPGHCETNGGTQRDSDQCVCKTKMPNCGCSHCRDNSGKCECHMGGHYGFMYGVELYGGLGDTEDFGIALSRQEHYLQPIFGFSFGGGMMMHLGIAKGLSSASDNLIRIAMVIEF